MQEGIQSKGLSYNINAHIVVNTLILVMCVRRHSGKRSALKDINTCCDEHP